MGMLKAIHERPATIHSVLQLTGGGDGQGWGNLYARFSGDETHRKPMVIAETASEYLPDVKGGASELDIKTAWWKQVRHCIQQTDSMLHA